jgi:hypothetical protein
MLAAKIEFSNVWARIRPSLSLAMVARALGKGKKASTKIGTPPPHLVVAGLVDHL